MIKTQQSSIVNLNKLRAMRNRAEYYELSAHFFNDLELDENVAPFLNEKLSSGQITSIDELGMFFIRLFMDTKKQETLLNSEI